MTIDDIQQKLKQESLDAYIIGYENRFLGQDILPQEHKIKYLCGFSGSAGMLAVTADKVFLFVDGRYELQARQEVDTNKISVVNQTPCLENVLCFLKQQKVQKIGFDGWSVAAGEIAEKFNLTGATVSYHLSQLKKADLITETKDKNFIFYELNVSVFEDVLVWIYNLGGNKNEKE